MNPFAGITFESFDKLRLCSNRSSVYSVVLVMEAAGPALYFLTGSEGTGAADDGLTNIRDLAGRTWTRHNTTLGVQASDATLTSLSGLSLAAGDVLYATAADTLARLPKGTAAQVLAMNAGATAPEWAGPAFRFVMPTTANLVATIQSLLDTYGSVYMAAGNYDFGAGTITIPTGSKLIGAGSELTIINYTGSDIPIKGVTLKHNTLAGFTLVGTGAALDGVRLRGIWHSFLNDIYCYGFSSGAGVHLIGNATVGGVYYNTLQNIRSGKLGSGNLHGFNLETDDGGLQRVNNNTLISCQAQYSLSHGYKLLLANTPMLLACDAEQNAGSGVHATSVSDLSVFGGYYENNAGGDIYLNTGTSRTTIDRPRLSSASKIVGPAAGGTGDRYSTADDALPGFTKYENWTQNQYTHALAAGTLTLESFAAASNQLYAKLSGDAQYRYILKNTGDQLFGSGAAVFDTTLARASKGIMLLNGGVLPAKHFHFTDADRVLLDSGVNQPLTIPVFTVKANTAYEFTCDYTLERSSGVVSHILRQYFGGTATVSNISYVARISQPNAGVVAWTQERRVRSAVQTDITVANAQATEHITVSITGVVRFAAAGTFFPGMQYSAPPGGAPTLKRDAYFTMTPIGVDVVTSRGDWA